MKDINQDWIKSVISEKKPESQQTESKTINWVMNNRGFNKHVKFKVLRANSKENGAWGAIVAQHWLDMGGEKNERVLCTEQTKHLKHLGITCPICEAHRKLKAQGFTDDDLTTEGRFGKVKIFEPNFTTNLKVVVVASDKQSEWDPTQISVLQFKGSYTLEWLVEKYMDAETPDFLDWNSNLIEFKRAESNGRWDRAISFATFNANDSQIAKIREENEEFTLHDVWPVPSDEQILKGREIADKLVAKFTTARQTVASSLNSSGIELGDHIPF